MITMLKLQRNRVLKLASLNTDTNKNVAKAVVQLSYPQLLVWQLTYIKDFIENRGLPKTKDTTEMKNTLLNIQMGMQHPSEMNLTSPYSISTHTVSLWEMEHKIHRIFLATSCSLHAIQIISRAYKRHKQLFCTKERKLIYGSVEKRSESIQILVVC